MFMLKTEEIWNSQGKPIDDYPKENSSVNLKHKCLYKRIFKLKIKRQKFKHKIKSENHAVAELELFKDQKNLNKLIIKI